MPLSPTSIITVCDNLIGANAEAAALNEIIDIVRSTILDEISNDMMSLAYPIGCLYITTSEEEPQNILNIGTWVRYGVGRCLVGINPGDPDFGNPDQTGGAKTHTLSVGEIASHNHTQDSHNHTQNSHTHTQDAHTHIQNSHTHTQDPHNHTQDTHTHVQNSHTHPTVQMQGGTTPTTVGTHIVTSTATGGSSRASAAGEIANAATATNQNTIATNQAATATNQSATPTNQNATATNQSATATNIAVTATNQAAGGGGSHNNIQPYIVVAVWKRVA